MKKILIIDDDPDILEAIQMILESEGYSSNATTKGDEVYTKVHKYKPNIIILDVLLSGNDGRTICKNLKNDVNTKNIPIIMISAHPAAKESIKECGADDFIPKPFSISTLLEKIKIHIT